MHVHGYAWLGEKSAFDREMFRRPPVGVPSTATPPEVADRHRRALAEFPVIDLPPIRTAHWLLKPPSLIRGTWHDPREAGAWFTSHLAGVVPRFAMDHERRPDRLDALAASAVERLVDGVDVSFGHYLHGTVFHSVALVTCSPNPSAPELGCPGGFSLSGD
ncbi:hypothetical protein ABT354_12440 [Streptomyces sp. NPDC000594]|uniref:hypothetical protein n=1 Tax=Streptomyces sp. NPDC000594 TaxID=3154261 RepID=UPI00331821F1